MIRTPYYLIDERRLAAQPRRSSTACATTSGAKRRAGAEVLLHLGRVRPDARSPRRHDEQLAVRGPARPRGVRREVHAYSVGVQRRRGRRGRRAFADKVIFNSISQLRALRRRRWPTPPSGCASTPASATRASTSPTRLAAHSRLGVIDVDAAARRRSPICAALMFHFNCENDDFDGLARADRRRSPTATPTCSHADGVGEPRRRDRLHGRRLSRRPVLRRCCAAFAERFGVQVYLEPGEACITARAELVTTVLDVVHNEVDVAIVDASVEAHMLDHLIYATSPAARRAGGRRPTASSIAGRTCLAGDVFGEYDLARRCRRRRRGPLRRRRRLHDGQDDRGSTACACRRSSSAASTVASTWCASSTTTTSERSLS